MNALNRQIVIAGALWIATAGWSLASAAVPEDSFGNSALSRGALPSRHAMLPSNFGVKLYSLSSSPESDTEGAGVRRAENDVVHLFGEIEPLAGESTNRRQGKFGLAWQHRLNTADRFAVSAEYGENAVPTVALPEAADSRAAFSWTRQWGGGFRPSLTGSVFMGDEYARDEAARTPGRRYVGFTVGGQLNLYRDHAPYVGFQMRRNFYDGYANGTAETFTAPLRNDERSLLSAGWRWRVQRQLSLEAGANFGLSNTSQDLYNQERNRVFFGTRFDFR